MSVYANFGISLPHSSGAQRGCGYDVGGLANAQPGDLIFFVGTYDTPGVSHVGIYVGDGVMIHCGDPIQYTSINSSYWQQHFYAFGRPAY